MAIENFDEAGHALTRHFGGGNVRRWARPALSRARAEFERHGQFPYWQAALGDLPRIEPSTVDLVHGVSVGRPGDCDGETRRSLEAALKCLCPWRKGPFELFGVTVDAEWRSDFKWARLAGHIEPVAGRRVLDVGCGNGYYAWRMAGAGARFVLGLDPSVLFVTQYLALRRYLAIPEVFVLPLGCEHLDTDLGCFDSAFSMGVLYHRRDPVEHLRQLRRALREGGQLVLETLVVDAGGMDLLIPKGRYARMRNVWAIPNVATAEHWLRDAGYEGIRCVDLSRTTIAEQRSTEWMTNQSLRDFLDGSDSSRTVEGYPAPLRGIFLAGA